MATTYRDELLKEVGNCRKMLQKYEDKLLKEEELPEDREKYYMERVNFWSNELKDMKQQLMNAQDQVQAVR